MKKRHLSLFLVFAMLLAAVPTVVAARFRDIDGHWAAAYIEEVTRLGFFNGTSETTFSPEVPMTRAMFITALGRLAGIDTVLWTDAAASDLFSDVGGGQFYTPYAVWAGGTRLVRGSSFRPDAPITRQEAARIVVRLGTLHGYEYRPDDGVRDTPSAFTDLNSADEEYIEYIEIFSRLGLFFGADSEADVSVFRPAQTVTRAEAAALISRIYHSLHIDSDLILPASLTLSAASVQLRAGDVYTLGYDISPVEALIATSVYWYSTDKAVVTVNQRGIVTAHGKGNASVVAYAENGITAVCEFRVTAGDLANENESYSEKCMRVFGEVVDDPRMYYYRNGAHDYNAASQDMVRVTVLAWDFGSNGSKITKTWNVYVHKNMAETVAAIFDEIYHGAEKFPIHYLGGFSRGGRSEHTIGTAIDINPNENYYCDPDGNPIVGSYWKPGEDPYSIPPDGDVVRAFRKYGYTQGIYWRSGYKDYMHFSYFAT